MTNIVHISFEMDELSFVESYSIIDETDISLNDQSAIMGACGGNIVKSETPLTVVMKTATNINCVPKTPSLGHTYTDTLIPMLRASPTNVYRLL